MQIISRKNKPLPRQLQWDFLFSLWNWIPKIEPRRPLGDSRVQNLLCRPCIGINNLTSTKNPAVEHMIE